MTNTIKSCCLLICLFIGASWSHATENQSTGNSAGLGISTVGSNAVAISWSPVDGANYYTIQVEDHTTGQVVAQVTTTTNSIVVSGLDLNHSNGICVMKESSDYIICDDIHP
jgi:hypothetical protein